MPSPAAERGHEARRRLLAAAVELIPERGWSAVSTRVLAERAGVTPSVVHYHYSSLSALLNEAAVDAMRQALDDVGQVFDAVTTPAAAIDAMLASVERFTGADPRSMLAVEAYLASSRDPELRDQIAGILAGFRQHLAHWLDAHGVPAPAATAAVIAATVDGLLMHRGLAADPAEEPVADVLRRLVD